MAHKPDTAHADASHSHTQIVDGTAVLGVSSAEEQANTVRQEEYSETRAREELEADILSLAASPIVRDALQTPNSTFRSKRDTTILSNTEAADETADNSQQALTRGLKAICCASCFKRLEIFHWMTMRLAQEGTMTEVLEWWCTEAEHQRYEADQANKEIIEEAFGVDMNWNAN